MRIAKLNKRGDVIAWEVDVIKRGNKHTLVADHADLGRVSLAEGSEDEVRRALDAHVRSVREHNAALAAQARAKLAAALGMTDDELNAFLAQCTTKPVALRRGWVKCVQGMPDAVIPQCETAEQAALVAANILRLDEGDALIG